MPHSPKEKNWAQKQRSAFLVGEYKFGFTPNKGLPTRFADPIPIGDILLMILALDRLQLCTQRLELTTSPVELYAVRFGLGLGAARPRLGLGPLALDTGDALLLGLQALGQRGQLALEPRAALGRLVQVLLQLGFPAVGLRQ